MAQTQMTRGDGLFSSTYHMQVCVSRGAHTRLPHTVDTHAGVNRQSDHHNGVGLYLQVVSYEDLVSYLDLSWGCLQGDNLLVFVAGV